MDDLMGTIGKIMSDPEQMKQISSLAASLGIPLPQDSPIPEPQTESAAADTSPSEPSAPITSSPAPNPPFSGISGDSLSSLLPLISGLQNSADDKYITFLRALQPLLSEQRRPRVDTAILLLKLLSFAPMLENAGILPKNHALSRIFEMLKGVLD